MRAILDLLLPPTCPGCGREGRALCDACAEPLHRRLDEPAGTLLGLPSGLPPGIVQLEWCGAFTGPTRAALHSLKYDSERRLVVPLAHAMAERWRRVAAGGDVLVPVPIHAAKRRQRGFNQAELLAREVGRVLGLPVADILERRERTQAQHALGRGARARNVGHAFGVRDEAAQAVARHWIVVVDDVVTTGATLAGCARALDEAGALAVSALALPGSAEAMALRRWRRATGSQPPRTPPGGPRHAVRRLSRYDDDGANHRQRQEPRCRRR